jgi:hypothetical protein
MAVGRLWAKEKDLEMVTRSESERQMELVRLSAMEQVSE